MLGERFQYYRRIFRAYLTPGRSHLDFWHETPEANPNALSSELGEYYMGFVEKADYLGHYDAAGIPMLNYRGRIGLQYNPIAIAQWGMGNYNRFRRSRDTKHRQKCLTASDWLRDHLEQNRSGLWVWNHHFDWEYRDTLRAPWYSGLAQGQGISLLVRAHRETGRPEYFHAAQRAFASFLAPIDDGGVTFTDAAGDVWFEEYIVKPPTHILNGFIWAAWGVYDYLLASGDPTARTLFQQAAQTLLKNLYRYDLGFWSLYEQSGTRLSMVASPFYHRLHIVQLRVMHQLTGEKQFAEFADRWESYGRSRAKRTRALCYKSAFKLCYY
ncbi:MAG TPA: D-glucuronyl C5-epimerase family protein [Terriglobales bacterium]|nr:D-glucuronyl C5-epimerase family protein [Terriglobales bacterium]